MDEKLLAKEKRLKHLFTFLAIVAVVVFIFSFTFIITTFISYIISIFSVSESGVENSDIFAFLVTLFWQFVEHVIQVIWVALIQFVAIALLVSSIALRNKASKSINEITYKDKKPEKNQFAYSFMDIVDEEEEE